MPAVAIKISEELAEAARIEAAHADRSLTGQIEHWAKLGRGAESTLPVPIVHLIKRFGGDPQAVTDPRLVSRLQEAVEHVRSGTAQAAAAADLLAQEAPVYEADPENPVGVVLVRPDGSRVRGRLVNRVFVPSER